MTVLAHCRTALARIDAALEALRRYQSIAELAATCRSAEPLRRRLGLGG